MKILKTLLYSVVLPICIGVGIQIEILARPQTSSAPLAFEVALLKRSQPNSGGISASACHGVNVPRPGSSVPLGRCRFISVNLRDLVLQAYPSPYIGLVPKDQLVNGGPDWIDSTLFDGEAKAADPPTVTLEQLREMLQTLLKERFKLSFHRETKDISGFLLVVVKQPSAAPNTLSPGVKPFPLRRGTLRQLTSMLTVKMKSMVLDKTDLQGTYDFSALPSIEDDTDGSFFTALHEQLGLKLVAQKIPVELVVIDHAERPSEENPMRSLAAGLQGARFNSARSSTMQ